MPIGFSFPITFHSIPDSVIVTSSIAPSAARIPELIFMPSNAGPAAQEQQSNLP